MGNGECSMVRGETIDENVLFPTADTAILRCSDYTIFLLLLFAIAARKNKYYTFSRLSSPISSL